MRHVDFAPLYRSTVGFDKLLTMLDGMAPTDQSQSYPPYNIERTGDTTYRVTMAVAGFDESEITIEAREHVLTVKGEKAEEQDAEGKEFLCELLYLDAGYLRSPIQNGLVFCGGGRRCQVESV